MNGRKLTLYDVLDLPRDSDATAIALAHRRAQAELERDTTAPDARRAALVHEAFEVLSDPERRAAYDASLNVSHFLPTPGGAAARPQWAGIVAGLVIVAAAVYFTVHRPAPPQAQGDARSLEDILAASSFSVGIVQSIDLSGKSIVAGLAVAIDEGVMVTTCHGLTAGAQLIVRLAGRAAPARVSMVDPELDLCKLAVEGAGSHPLPLSGQAPRVGENVYAVSFGTDGLSARPATIKALIPTPKGNALELSVPVAPAASGGPLVDTAGRLVGIMTAPHAFGADRNVAMPATALNNPRWLSR